MALAEVEFHLGSSRGNSPSRAIAGSMAAASSVSARSERIIGAPAVERPTFVRPSDPVQASRLAHAKRRSLQRLTKFTDALLFWGNILGHEIRPYMPLPGPMIGPALRS
jgi:hypothetical protein